ncbi:hypothetical protein [Streptomyces blastmyceticus]|uniref:Secreted protein n=1 Tax=Streptomyces blastmyceticus TaxID=68180 RepID=A0ABN0WYD9_9ACTN
MTHRIWLTLQRTLAHLLAALIPATGRRRTPNLRPQSGNCLALTTAHRPRTASGLRLLIRVFAPPQCPGKPGSQPAAFTDPFPLVRPYVLTHEPHRRRTDLDGNDFDALVPEAVAV